MPDGPGEGNAAYGRGAGDQNFLGTVYADGFVSRGGLSSGLSSAHGDPWYDVLGFGADPTGTVDSYAAFAQAITAVRVTGGILWIPPGTYLLSLPLDLHLATDIVVQGTAERLRGPTTFAPAATLILTDGTQSRLIDVRGSSSVQILNLGVRCSDAAFTGNLIDAQPYSGTATAELTIRNVQAGGATSGVTNSCIKLDTSVGTIIDHVLVYNCIYGIESDGASSSVCEINRFRNGSGITGALIHNPPNATTLIAPTFEGSAFPYPPGILEDGGAILSGMAITGGWFGDFGALGRPTVALQADATASQLSAGYYIWGIIEVHGTTESPVGQYRGLTSPTDSAHTSVALSAIPLGGSGCTARIVCRSKVYQDPNLFAQSGVTMYAVATIPDNTTTTYADITPDSALSTIKSFGAWVRAGDIRGLGIGPGFYALNRSAALVEFTGNTADGVTLGPGVHIENDSSETGIIYRRGTTTGHRAHVSYPNNYRLTSVGAGAVRETYSLTNLTVFRWPSNVNRLIVAGLNANCSVVLPSATAWVNREIEIIRADPTAFLLTLTDSGGATINGVTSYPIGWGAALRFVSDGTNWLPSLALQRPVPTVAAFDGIPGVRPVSVTATAQVANKLRYAPFRVEDIAVINTLTAEVSTAGAGGTVVRFGIYAAGPAWQPGSLVVDLGTIAADSQTVQTLTPAATPLGMGNWLLAWNGDGVAALRMLQCTCDAFSPIDSVLGTSPFISQVRVNANLAVMPDPGTAWDTLLTAATPFQYPATFGYTRT